MSKNLITEETRKAYLDRLQKILKYGLSEQGDKLFITKLVAESEQINNLHVKAKVNELEIHNDAPDDLGGSRSSPTPMESLLGSFANCLEISALLYFSFSNVKVNSIKVKVETTFDKRYVLPDNDAPLPGFYDINYTWFIDSNERLEKIERVLEKAVKNCPVKGTFSRTHKYKQNIIILNK